MLPRRRRGASFANAYRTRAQGRLSTLNPCARAGSRYGSDAGPGLFGRGGAVDGDGVGVLVQRSLQGHLLAHQRLDLGIEGGEVIDLAVRLVEDLRLGAPL